MQITAPTTSTKIMDVLTESQRESIILKSKGSQKLSIRIEAHGGTVWWTSLDDTAVLNKCCSISDGDIEFIDLKNTPITASNISVIAEADVTFNIEVV